MLRSVKFIARTLYTCLRTYGPKKFQRTDFLKNLPYSREKIDFCQKAKNKIRGVGGGVATELAVFEIRQIEDRVFLEAFVILRGS